MFRKFFKKKFLLKKFAMAKYNHLNCNFRLFKQIDKKKKEK